MTELLTLSAMPALLSAEEMRAERPARLLETGEYADKKLTLTESDLDAIVARFSGNLPVKVEHTDSPLDPLGHVRRIWRDGNALLGMLAFPDDLAGFLRRRGAAKLSVGLSREPLALLEVSLVLKPRVASATLMSKEKTSEEKMSENEAPDTQREIVQLRAQLAAREVETQIARFKAQGRIVPASEAAARALLLPGDAAVLLADGPEPVASVFARFLAAQPPVILLGETMPAGAELDGFTHYEHTFLSKQLGVDPAKVAALIQEEQTAAQKGKRHAY